MSTKKVEVEVKKYAIKVVFDSSETATIHQIGLCFIIDKKEEAVIWLAGHGYKEEDIEVVGEKPANWITVFPPVVKAEAISGT